MKSNIFNILYLAPYEQSILKRYPSILKAWNQYKWQECIDATNDIIKEFSPLIQDSYQYILFRIMMYCHFMLRNFDVSYDYALRVLDYTYELKDPSQTSRALMDLARIHKIVEDVPIAIEILKNAIQLNPNNHIALAEISLAYLEIKQFDFAECSMNRIRELLDCKDVDLPAIVLPLIQIYLYIQQENYTSAEKILLDIEKEFFNPSLSLVSSLYYLLSGIVFFNTEKLDLALNNLNKAIDISKTYHRHNIMVNALKLRSFTNEKMKNFQQAYYDRIEYNNLSNQFNNAIFNQRLSVLKKYYYRKQNEFRNQQIIEKAIRLNTVSLMADNMIYEITPHLHSIHLNVDSILFWDKRQPGILPSLFLEEVKMIKESVIRTEQIILQMKNFWSASKKELSIEKVDINHAVINAKNIILNNLKDKDINIRLKLSEKKLNIEANPILIEQIFINLLNNAIQALSKVEKKDKLIILTTEDIDHEIQIKVEDNASGFYYESTNNPLDSISYNKQNFDGMGLGLMIVKNFLDRFSGFIQFKNNEMGGATIIIKLPLAE